PERQPAAPEEHRPVAEQLVGDVPVPAVAEAVVPAAERPLAAAAAAVVPDQGGQHGPGGRLVLEVGVDDEDATHRAEEVLDALPAAHPDAETRARDAHPGQPRRYVSEFHARSLRPFAEVLAGAEDVAVAALARRRRAVDEVQVVMRRPPAGQD